MELMHIEILPPQLANQIAAGEVVERPSSVVKELVENSLDAGATHIDIQIEQGGAGLILIRDNGSGIPKEELSLALCRHATSKIKNMDDLLSILSFGFRGEALASISSVSRLTLTSKTAEQSEAWQVYAEGREMNAVIKPAAHPVGTSVEVRNLFYNTPARRKFLRAEKTEFNHIDEIIKRIALIRYDVAFTLSHQAKKLREYRVNPKKELSQKQIERIEAVCGSKFIENAQHIEWTHFDLSITAWIWPNLGLENETHFTKGIQFCYVNGRIVKDKVILHAIKQAFAHYYPALLASDDKLAYVIYFHLPPEQVDVNVHPAKHEVRFHQARLVHDFIYQAVVESLKAQEYRQHTDSNQPIIPVISDENRQAAGDNQFATQSSQLTPSEHSVLEKVAPNSGFSSLHPSSVPEKDTLSATKKVDTPNDILETNPNFEKKQTPFNLSEYMAISDGAKEQNNPQVNRQQINNSYSHQTKAPTRKERQLYESLLFCAKTKQTESSCDMTALVSEKHDGKETQQTQFFSADNETEENVTRYKTFGKALYILNQQTVLLVRKNSVERDELFCVFLPDAVLQLKKLQLHHVVNQGVSQALLVPITLKLNDKEWEILKKVSSYIPPLMISYRLDSRLKKVEVDTVPAPLRHCDISSVFMSLILFMGNLIEKKENLEECELANWLLQESINYLAKEISIQSREVQTQNWSLAQAISLITELENLGAFELENIILFLSRRVEGSY